MLVDRAIKLAHPSFHSKNLSLIQCTMNRNWYPESFTNRIINQRLSKIRMQSSPHDTFDASRIINLPYATIIHHQLFRLFQQYNITMVTNNKHNISSIIGSTKDIIETQEKANLVYKIQCGDCNAIYIGQTKRRLKIRINEHKNNVKHRDAHHTALSQHSIQNEHTFNFDDVKILNNETYLRKRLILEMIQIKSHIHSINFKTDIDKLSNIYELII